ncbi:DUF411 domain-containing protein [Pararhizobium haloflavum]|uniref:DUF411 domain-containing protein n=1 Tax=Pararhizobium haloflavum TaxID=2037914 RepID=UPI000C185C2C|nr:DUF411 domain-containing protein [Pararhizobium haloflavum]
MRREIVLLVFLAAATSASADDGEDRKIEVFKTQTCACCVAWVARLEEAGFVVESSDLPMSDLMAMKLELGVPSDRVSCHTAVVADYVIEGHVPAKDIERLVDSGKEAVGLVVAGMPVGSPGMEYGTRRDAFDVELIGRHGEISVFASYDDKE